MAVEILPSVELCLCPDGGECTRQQQGKGQERVSAWIVPRHYAVELERSKEERETMVDVVVVVVNVDGEREESRGRRWERATLRRLVRAATN